MEATSNPMKHPIMRILFGFLVLCQMAAAQQAGRTVFLVRHAEKTSAAPDATLTPAGEARASCLAWTLKDAGIKHIYVSDVKRTQQTADPLAKALNLTPTVIPARDISGLVRGVIYSPGGGNVLVVGHGDTLPVIVARLQGGGIPPITDNEYDRLIVVTMIENAGTPAANLRYCSSGGPAPPAPAQPKPATVPAKKKAPAKKS